MFYGIALIRDFFCRTKKRPVKNRGRFLLFGAFARGRQIAPRQMVW
jgi:hypothetical protein